MSADSGACTIQSCRAAGRGRRLPIWFSIANFMEMVNDDGAFKVPPPDIKKSGCSQEI